MTRHGESRVFLALSMVSIVASAALFYHAETARWVTHDSWYELNCCSGKFCITSCYDQRWFATDFLGVAFSLLALVALIYGVWLKKSA
jgi:hypothetical protein